MPELPEVETIACDLRAWGLPGRQIERVRLLRPNVVRGSAAAFRRTLKGRRFSDVDRHGKLLLLGLDGAGHVIVHLKMTGQLSIAARGEPVARHTHAVFELEGGSELRFRDVRRFGYLALVDDEGLRAALSVLGPDALEITWPEFRAALGRRASLKPLLMDQRRLAGVGNIYANEALFAARLNPGRLGASLSPAEARRLHRAMGRVLREAISCRGSSISDFVDARGRVGRFQERHRVYRKERCPRCQGELARQSWGGRSTFWCPACQPI